MYLDFYNLKAEPFRITPDPEFLYRSPSHQEALAAIVYAVDQGKGFMALVGEVGLGKTTLLQTFLKERAGVQEKVIYLFSSRFSFKGLLRTLARELDMEAAGQDTQELVNLIYEGLIREYARGKNVVLLVDEAQGLPEETLEGLRLISNLETPTEKLLQIILVGQPELEEKLDRFELRQLRQRIAVRTVLSPLTREESREYLRFRLEKAGGRVEEIFTSRALELIVRRGEGIPRTLNVLADNALVTGFGYQRKPITVKVVREVIADLEGRRKPFLTRFAPAAILASLLMALGVIGVSVYYGPTKSGSKVSMVLPEADQAGRQAAQRIERVEFLPTAGPLPDPDREVLMPAATASPAGKKVENRIRETVPAAAGEEPGRQAEAFPLTRKVREGENLYRMILEVYGASTPELWDLVRRHNPRIKADLKIMVGQKIVFPERESSVKEGEVKKEGAEGSRVQGFK